MLIVNWVAPQKVSRVKIDIYAPLKSETTRKTLAQVKGRVVNHIESLVGKDHNANRVKCPVVGASLNGWPVHTFLTLCPIVGA